MTTEHIKGLIAAPFTPMHPDGSLNLAAIPGYYRMLVANGVVGAFICGSTGEGVSLTLQEKMDLMKAWGDVENADPSFKIFALVGGTSINECIGLAKYAQACSLYAVAITAPFYFKPASAEVLADICVAIGSAIPGMPFYYYHIPVLTGVGHTMFDLLQAIDGRLDNFAGIKYTHEDFMDFLSCMTFRNGRYDMLWGRDENMLAALALGAKGAVGSTFNYAAPLYHALIDAFEQHDLVRARELQQQSIDMIRLLGKYGGIATGKAYMKKMGLDCGAFRLPVRNMEAAAYDRFSEDVDRLGFDGFKSAVNP